MNTDSWFDTAEKLIGEKHYQEALACCDRALAEDPEDVEALLYKGYLFVEFFHDNDSAKTCYEEALRINPRNAEAWRLVGVVFHNLERYRKAISCYNRAVRINRRNHRVWKDKGDALNCLGRSRKAIACYRKAVEENPRDAAAWYMMALTYDEIGRAKKAVESLEKVIELAASPDEPLVRQAAGKLEELTGAGPAQP